MWIFSKLAIYPLSHVQTNGDQLSVIFNNNIVKYDYVPAKWYDY